MHATAQRRPENPRTIWLARAAALATVISLQLVWVGVMVCAARCARGACPADLRAAEGPAKTGAEQPDHCDHSETAPESSSKRHSTPHQNNCPASSLRYWSAATMAVGATQARQVAPVLLIASVPATAAASVPAGGPTHGLESFLPLIVPAVSPVPLRI